MKRIKTTSCSSNQKLINSTLSLLFLPEKKTKKKKKKKETKLPITDTSPKSSVRGIKWSLQGDKKRPFRVICQRRNKHPLAAIRLRYHLFAFMGRVDALSSVTTMVLPAGVGE
ncbi:hypothetical protein CEXT_251021 [Caerostris extrusa]|uniref:Uncharacterized protein n=1 Tax=Caerostris extrusa TaxID=172846 RepID=A0AAV4M3M8_CAEEX|nr:hypothetical protein CEXT_251021 [Caerostris extrusa]